MSTQGLKNRLDRLGKIIHPELKVLPVLVKEGEDAETAIERVKQEEGIEELPETCITLIINIEGIQAANA